MKSSVIIICSTRLRRCSLRYIHLNAHILHLKQFGKSKCNSIPLTLHSLDSLSFSCPYQNVSNRLPDELIKKHSPPSTTFTPPSRNWSNIFPFLFKNRHRPSSFRTPIQHHNGIIGMNAINPFQRLNSAECPQ